MLLGGWSARPLCLPEPFRGRGLDRHWVCVVSFPRTHRRQPVGGEAGAGETGHGACGMCRAGEKLGNVTGGCSWRGAQPAACCPQRASHPGSEDATASLGFRQAVEARCRGPSTISCFFVMASCNKGRSTWSPPHGRLRTRPLAGTARSGAATSRATHPLTHSETLQGWCGCDR